MVFRERLGTLNPFLDGYWIIDTVNIISINHVELKLITEMFEMFALLIKLLILRLFKL